MPLVTPCDSLQRTGRGYESVGGDDGYADVSGGQGRYLADDPAWPIGHRQAVRDARGRALDAGCGAGRHAPYLQRRGLDVLGIDTSRGPFDVAAIIKTAHPHEEARSRSSGGKGPVSTIRCHAEGAADARQHRSFLARRGCDVSSPHAHSVVHDARRRRRPCGRQQRFFNPGIATLGSLRLTKRSWGLLTTYSQELGVAAVRLAQQAGTQINLRVSLDIPGTVVAANATGREGRTLVWSAIPQEGPMQARARTINWPVALFGAAVIAATVWLRAR
jgi:SAM-dependent methyltransferase